MGGWRVIGPDVEVLMGDDGTALARIERQRTDNGLIFYSAQTVLDMFDGRSSRIFPTEKSGHGIRDAGAYAGAIVPAGVRRA